MQAIISLSIIFGISLYFGLWIVKKLWHTTETSTCQYEVWELEDFKLLIKRKKFYRENQWKRRNGNKGCFRIEEKQFIL